MSLLSGSYHIPSDTTQRTEVERDANEREEIASESRGREAEEGLHDSVNSNFRILSNRSASVPNRETARELESEWERSDFITDCLHYHNVYRQRHGAPPLVLCAQLCLEAQTWANHLAHINKFFYRNGKDIGQNLYCRPTNTLQVDITGQEVTAYWYSSIRAYNYMKEPEVLHANVNAGHFTQIVWVSTKEIGVGKARSRTGKIIVVAYYRPPGNIPGLFHTNVLPPLPPDDSERTSESGSESSASKSSEFCR